MKIVIMIVCLGLFLVIGLHGCATVTGGGTFEEVEGRKKAGNIVIILSLLFLAGGLLALKNLMLTTVVLLIGGITALYLGSKYHEELPIWGGIALIIAVISFISFNEEIK